MQQLSWKRLRKLVGYTVGVFLICIGLWMSIWYFSYDMNGKEWVYKLKNFSQNYKEHKESYEYDYKTYVSELKVSNFDWDSVTTDETIINIPIITDTLPDGEKFFRAQLIIPMEEQMLHYSSGNIQTGFIIRLLEPSSILRFGISYVNLAHDKALLKNIVQNSLGIYGNDEKKYFTYPVAWAKLSTYKENNTYGGDCLQFINAITFYEPLGSDIITENCRVIIYKDTQEAREYYSAIQDKTKTYLKFDGSTRTEDVTSLKVSIQKMK